MSATYDGNFTIPVSNGPREFWTPFLTEGDTTTRAFRQEYLQRQDSWTPPTFMQSVVVDARVYYLVSESPTAHIGAGMVQFVREFAMIPQSRTTPRQMSYTFRGIGSDQVYSPVNISSEVISGGVHTFTCASNPGISVGDRVLIEATQTQYGAGIQTNFSTRRTALAGTSGTTVVTDPVIAPGNNSLYFRQLRKVEDGRDPRTDAVTAWVSFDYYVPGITPGISNVADINTYDPELIIDVNGKETLTYTDTTTPSRTDYQALVAAGTLIVAEKTTIKRWMGDIFEASTPFVKAE